MLRFYFTERQCLNFRENRLVNLRSLIGEILSLQSRDHRGRKPPITPSKVKSETCYAGLAIKHPSLQAYLTHLVEI